MNDALLHEAKVEAAKRKISLTALIEEALEASFKDNAANKDEYESFQIPTFKGSGLCNGVNLDDSKALQDLMDDVSL